MMVIFFFVVQQIFMLTFFGLKFYRAVNKFSLKKRHKIILKYFQRFVGFCNIKTNKHIRGVI